jgi:hypothetical protein
VADGTAVAQEAVPGNGEGRLAAKLPSSASWCCAELWSARGDLLRAVTSPIYLRP